MLCCTASGDALPDLSCAFCSSYGATISEQTSTMIRTDLRWSPQTEVTDQDGMVDRLSMMIVEMVSDGTPANGGASEIILVSQNAIDLRGCESRPGVEIGCCHDSALTQLSKGGGGLRMWRSCSQLVTAEGKCGSKKNSRPESLSSPLSSRGRIKTGHKGCNAKAFCKKNSLIRVSGFPFHMGRRLPGDGAGVSSSETRLAPLFTIATVSVSSGTEFDQISKLKSHYF